MTFNDLKIGHRIGLAFAAVLITIAGATVISQTSMAELAKNNADVALAAGLQTKVSEIHLQAKENAINSLLILVASSAEQQAKIGKTIEAGAAAVDLGLKELEAVSAQDAEQASLLADVRKRQTTYQKGVQRIVGMVTSGKQAEATFAADEEMIPMMAPFLLALSGLEELAATRLGSIEIENKSLIKNNRLVSALTGLGNAVLALVAGFLLVVSLTRPLARAVKLAETVADGDLSARSHVTGRDEVSQLLRTLNRMAENLSVRVAEVRQSADQIASASAQIATGNTDLSVRTEQQAGSLQSTAAAMEQVKQTFEGSSRDARAARDVAATASQVATKGGDVVGQVVGSMKDINDSSKRIAEITSVIDSIAFQTNILALNAAVEAARAGEQGRGFAVVASEVRNLAQRSAQAAREIKSLIAASVERVQRGTQQVDEAGSTMHEVVRSIQQVTQIMASISAASEQQSAGVREVGAAVNQMDQSTQQNASLVEQSAAAAESLKQQAQELVQAVAVFRLQHA